MKITRLSSGIDNLVIASRFTIKGQRMLVFMRNGVLSSIAVCIMDAIEIQYSI